MKKIILGALALMIGAVGFAQNNHTNVRQNGTDLVSGITQVGYGNTANQLQNPSGTWDNGSPGGVSENNQAYIDQAGSENFAQQSQIAKDDLATNLQRGNHNESYQTQKSGFGKMAHVNQYGNYNKAYQTQAGGSSIAVINQYETGNTATQLQDGAYSEAYSTQAGYGNTSYQEQFGTGLWNVHNMAIVDQAGDENYGFQSQGPSALGETAFLLQRGNHNESWQIQDGESNVSNVLQYGTYHDANTQQLGTGNVTNVHQYN